MLVSYPGYVVSTIYGPTNSVGPGVEASLEAWKKPRNYNYGGDDERLVDSSIGWSWLCFRSGSRGYSSGCHCAGMCIAGLSKKIALIN